VRDAAEKKCPGIAQAAAVHDDHIDLFAVGDLEDLVGGLALDRASDDVAHASLAHARLGRAGQTVAQGAREVVTAFFFLHRHVFGFREGP
jgi:hypothetical protein